MADHYTTIIQQLAGKVETTPGIAETLTAAEVALRITKDAQYIPDPVRTANEEIGLDFGAQVAFVKGSKAALSFSTNLKTSGAVGTAPAIGRYLKACGCKEQTVKAITIGAISGGDSIFYEGETYSATGGKTGIIARDISGAGSLRYVAVTGGDLAASDVVTANGDSATCSGTSALYATKYSPQSLGQSTATIQLGIRNSNGTTSQDLLEKISGAMGNCVLSGSALQQFQAKLDFQGVGYGRTAGSLFTGETYESTVPPLFSNATCQVNGVTVRPASFEFDFGNTTEMDPDPSTGGGNSGYDRARVTKRAPKIKLDPIQQLIGTLSLQSMLVDGGEFPVSLIIGATPNIIEIYAKRCQVSSWSPGERVGLRSASVDIDVMRSQTIADCDWSIYFR